MKKAFLLSILFGLFFFPLAGCNSDPVQTSQMASDTSETAQVSQTSTSSETKANAVTGTYKETVLANGIGRSVNAITGNYAEVSSQYKDVFDSQDLSGLTITKTNIRHQEASSYISSSAKDFLSSVSAGYSTKNTSVSSPLFTNDLSSRFQLGVSFDYTSETRQLYYTFSQDILASLLEIDGYQDLSMLQAALSSGFQDDASKIEDGTLTPETFLSRYGTHVVLAAYFGGKIRCDYYLAANNTSVNISAYSSYKSLITGLLSSVISGTMTLPGSLDISTDLKFSKQNQTENFNAKAWGGKNIPMATETQFSSNYAEWIDSFNGTDDYTTLTDFPSNSLLSVWELLPSKYDKAKQALKSEFEEESANAYSNYLSRYVIPDDKFGEEEMEISPLNCAADNGYDSSIQDSNEIEKQEIDPQIVKIKLTDVIKTQEGKYKKGFEDFKIGLVTLQDTSKIRLTHCDGSSATAAELCSDDYSIKGVKGVNTESKEDTHVGYGTCFISVAFADGSEPFLNITTDVLKDTHQIDTDVVVLSQNNSEDLQNKKIKRITLVLVYEIKVLWPGAFGITQKTFTNWRVEASFDFC